MHDIAETQAPPVDLDRLSDNDLVTEDIARKYLGGTMSPISPATLWRGIKKDRYPAPIKAGTQIRRWRVGGLRECVRRAVEMA